MLLSSSPLISFENEASAPVAFKLAFNYLKAGKVSGEGQGGCVAGQGTARHALLEPPTCAEPRGH